MLRCLAQGRLFVLGAPENKLLGQGKASSVLSFFFFKQESPQRRRHGPVSSAAYSVLPYGHDVVVHRGGNRAVPAEHAGEQQQPDISTSASGRQLPRRAAPSQVRRPLCGGDYAVAARRHHADGGRAPGILC